ncbi:MAG TPA: methylated-DNA--[protein]-cysteine S-methyltransferase [Candidatus Limnocylindrales bacterium]|nr:methylated-DNA--[protein]-cysteine S-methyltransferase [Candidatus Limnocylindrales bacterium]
MRPGGGQSPNHDEALALVTAATPWGPAPLVVGSDGVHALWLRADPDDVARSTERRTRRHVVALRDATAPVRAAAAIALADLEAFGSRRLDRWRLEVRLAGLGDWDRRVLVAVRRVPWGATTSYGQIARAAGSPGAARAAGGAVGRNPVGLMVPCHRVIAADGSIGGYGGRWPADRDELIALKRSLLAHEGSATSQRS